MVKVRHGEGLTNYIDPESCVAAREGVREALTGVRAGQAIERRNFILREAHALRTAEGNTGTNRHGKDRAIPRRQRPWHVRKSSAREPGDLMICPQAARPSGPRREGEMPKPSMNGREKSDPSVLPMKPTNKAGRPAAEPVEGRDGAERNVGLQSTIRTQCREIVSRAQACIRRCFDVMGRVSPT